MGIDSKCSKERLDTHEPDPGLRFGTLATQFQNIFTFPVSIF
jgi:hypothetical protein